MGNLNVTLAHIYILHGAPGLLDSRDSKPAHYHALEYALEHVKPLHVNETTQIALNKKQMPSDTGLQEAIEDHCLAYCSMQMEALCQARYLHHPLFQHPRVCSMPVIVPAAPRAARHCGARLLPARKFLLTGSAQSAPVASRRHVD